MRVASHLADPADGNRNTAGGVSSAVGSVLIYLWTPGKLGSGEANQDTTA